MKFTNTSAKIIGIGKTYILPDQTVELTEEEASSGSLRAYVEMGFGKFEGEPVPSKTEEKFDQAAFDAAVQAAAQKLFEEQQKKAKAEEPVFVPAVLTEEPVEYKTETTFIASETTVTEAPAPAPKKTRSKK